MQGPFIKLKEVIWEITDKCRNNCSYCGSKKDLNKIVFDTDRAYAIAKELAVLAPEEINFSGGDPLEIRADVYEKIMAMFPVETKFKIIINPLSRRHIDDCYITSVLEKMDVVGISVNTLEELAAVKTLPKVSRPITIITNFSLLNFYDFEDIEEFVLDNDLGWQIQYTIDEKLGIYNSDKAVMALFDTIDSHFNTHQRWGKTFIADNMNCGECFAGTKGVGILSNGDVVPCLSMRSYMDEMPVMGNAVEDGMLNVWEKGFAAFRCSEFKCCKDACKEKQLFFTQKPTIMHDPPQNPSWPQPHDIVIMYGVQIPKWPVEPWQGGGTMAYAVQEGQTFVYGVQTPSYKLTTDGEETFSFNGMTFYKEDDENLTKDED